MRSSGGFGLGITGSQFEIGFKAPPFFHPDNFLRRLNQQSSLCEKRLGHYPLESANILEPFHSQASDIFLIGLAIGRRDNEICIKHTRYDWTSTTRTDQVFTIVLQSRDDISINHNIFLDAQLMAVITISREYGSRGEQIGQHIARELGYRYFDKEILVNVSRLANATEEQIREYDETYQHSISTLFKKLFLAQPAVAAELPYLYPSTIPSDYQINQSTKGASLDPETVAAFFFEVVDTLWNHGRVVIIGRASQKILEGKPHTLHIRFVSAIEDRIEAVMAMDALTEVEAQSKIASIDRDRENYLKSHHNVAWDDPKLYHLVINTSCVDIKQATRTVVAAADQLEKSD